MIMPADSSACIIVPKAKVEGAFIALAAGDALGWPQELAPGGRRRSRQATSKFRDWKWRGGSRFSPHVEPIKAGEYSDDTQLTLAVARSRLEAGTGWWTNFVRRELPLWTLYQRGGGSATKRAAASWVRGVQPWKQPDEESIRRYFNAGGNGVAMRVLPHAVYHAAEADPKGMLHDVLADGIATHGHPRALVGATAFAYAAWWLLRVQRTIAFGELVSVLQDSLSDWGNVPSNLTTKNGWLEAAYRSSADYEKLWRQVVDEMATLLAQVHGGLAAGSLADDEEILASLGAFGASKGAGTVSAAAAIYLAARYAPQPSRGILCAAFATGSDTDTLASMTGGLLGILAGSEWLPSEWLAVQDSSYLRELAGQLATSKPSAQGGPSPAIGHRELDMVWRQLFSGVQLLDLGDGRCLRLLETKAEEPSSNKTVTQRWHLEMPGGQTIYITKTRRSMDTGQQLLVQDEPQVESTQTRALPAQKCDAQAIGIKLTVKSLPDALAFYEGLLGLSTQLKSERFVSFGAVSLVDSSYAVQLSQGAVTPDAQDRRNRIGIVVNDLDAVYAALVRQGSSIGASISKTPWGERSLHCLDPDGNVVEIIERSRARNSGS